jgi:hypothetical protein
MEMNINSYTKFIKTSINNNYNLIKFNQANEFDKFIILRHDIDIDLYAAFELSKLENKLGCTSTYFTMIDNPLYNIFSKESKLILHEMVKMGHDIGIHFDSSLHSYEESKLFQKIVDDVMIISDLLQFDIKFISFHQPEKRIFKKDILIENKYKSVYNKEFMQDILYVSDSAHLWRDEDIIFIIENNHSDKIHFLSHPIWWISSGNQSTQEKVENVIENQNRRNKKSARDLLNNYKKDIIVYTP